MTPRERLNKYQPQLQDVPAFQQAQHEAAIEISEALVGLTVAVNDMANRMVTVTNNLQHALEKASDESTNAANESAKVSQKLNSLTVWIIVAAILSAAAACIQAGVAVYTATHPTH